MCYPGVPLEVGFLYTDDVGLGVDGGLCECLPLDVIVVNVYCVYIFGHDA